MALTLSRRPQVWGLRRKPSETLQHPARVSANGGQRDRKTECFTFNVFMERGFQEPGVTLR